MPVDAKEFLERFGLPTAPARQPRVIPEVHEILRPIATSGLNLNAEQALSSQLYHLLIAEFLASRLRCTFTCIPNELPIPSFTEQLRRMAAMLGLKRRAMGGIPGAADWVFVWEGGGGWIELKTPGGDKVMRKVKRVGGDKLHPVKQPPGRMSPEQVTFQRWCTEAGANHAVCHAAPEAIDILRTWGALAAKP